MNRQIWCNDVYNALNKDKKIVLVAGASSSGKSFSSEVLCKYFKQKGLRAIVYSADNYYKGIARTIVEKALQKSNNIIFLKNKNLIISTVRSVIEFSPFTETHSSHGTARHRQDRHHGAGGAGVRDQPDLLYDHPSHKTECHWSPLHFQKGIRRGRVLGH